MKIHSEVDPSGNIFMVTLTSYIFEKYYPHFCGMIKNLRDSPKNINISKVESDSVMLAFPIPEGCADTKDLGNGMAKTSVNIEFMRPLMKEIDRFLNLSIRNITKHLEFLPVNDLSGGYSENIRKNDILQAIKNKRDFLLIDSYREYLENMKNATYCYNQVYVKYGTPDYADIAIWIERNKIKELKNYFKKNSKVVDWL